MDTSRKNLRKFGMTMAAIFIAISLVILMRRKSGAIPTASISILFFTLGLAAPMALRQVYINWMRFAFILSWVNTRILLMVIFYLIFAPVGLIMRLLQIDPLARKIEKNKGSYWQKKQGAGQDTLSYERRF